MSLLVAAVDGGSLSAAGRKFGMPLPTVSRKISELEAHIKTRLLLRTTRRLTLTDAGRLYVDHCRRILHEITEAERAAAGEYTAPKGQLVVTAPLVFGRLHVVPIVVDFLKAYPQVDIRLALGDRVVDLLESHVDLAVRIGELPDSSLIATRVGLIRQVVCASPEYLDARGRPQTPEELTAHDCITFEGLNSPNGWTLFKAPGSQINVPVHSRLIVSTAEGAIDAAVAGVGLTRVLSYQAARDHAQRRLEFVLEAFEPKPWPVSFVYAGQGQLPVKLRAFLDFATPRIRERLIGERG
ncbi:LysR substrate-binding domain-containing protein [Rudaea sp.]|uniref:LysR substrate-binding domain-containing protein n=1 Tax=Rudaea sp. TaxID=2136325 RepID=UPI0032205C19